MSSELGVERPTTLTLPQPQGERRVHFRDVDARPHHTHHHTTTTSTTISPRKSRPDPDFRPKRKRSMSFSSAGEQRWFNRWRNKRAGPVLPYKFLLGGNITDPLNLGSLDKEDPPTPTPGGVGGEGSGGGRRSSSAAVRVIIPPNINDPLNLDASSDNEELHTDALQRQLRRRRRRKRKRRLSEPADGIGGRESDLGIVIQERGGGGGGCALPKRAPTTITLQPLTIKTDLLSPPLPPPPPPPPVDSKREGSSNQAVTASVSKPGPTTTTTTATTTPVTTETTTATPTTPTNTQQRPQFKKQRHKPDKIVSPVIPQACDRKRHPSHTIRHSEQPHLSQQNLQPPRSYNPKNELFQFGNYNKYYGYRNPDQTPDVRLGHLKREWFEGKDILDIGCNIGHVALTVARDYNPKRVVGIDIDKKLVNIAQKNIKHYVRKGDAEEASFPKSMRLLYGPLKPPVQPDGVRAFPHNVKFVHGNYVLESDELLETVRPEFDLVLCLSITKWIHLNWGDAGLKRFFRRIFYNLRPGGRLVLEPQAWPSYNKRRKLTKRIFENYKSICLFPDKFNDFLLHEVGFSTSEKLVTPNHTSRGFQRPIIIYTKAGGSSKTSPTAEETTTTTTTTTTTATTTTATADDDVFYPGEAGGSKDCKRKRSREESEKECLSANAKLARRHESVSASPPKPQTTDTMVRSDEGTTKPGHETGDKAQRTHTPSAHTDINQPTTSQQQINVVKICDSIKTTELNRQATTTTTSHTSLSTTPTQPPNAHTKHTPTQSSESVCVKQSPTHSEPTPTECRTHSDKCGSVGLTSHSADNKEIKTEKDEMKTIKQNSDKDMSVVSPSEPTETKEITQENESEKESLKRKIENDDDDDETKRARLENT